MGNQSCCTDNHDYMDYCSINVKSFVICFTIQVENYSTKSPIYIQDLIKRLGELILVTEIQFMNWKLFPDCCSLQLILSGMYLY